MFKKPELDIEFPETPPWLRRKEKFWVLHLLDWWKMHFPKLGKYSGPDLDNKCIWFSDPAPSHEILRKTLKF